MAGMCCGVVGETEASATVEPSVRAATKRRRMEIRQFKLLTADMEVSPPENGKKRQKVEAFAPVSPPRECQNAVESCVVSEGQWLSGDSETKCVNGCASSSVGFEVKEVKERPRFGMTSVCGRRRDMEDTVAIHPSLCLRNHQNPDGLHFFGVYDGHGCSHVAWKCKDRLHEIVRDELEGRQEASWKETMEQSFSRMDKEVTDCCSVGVGVSSSNCRCELQTPQCDAVGSTAVIAVVTPDNIVVSNCGDSRAVLCRNGVAIPLSSDHKPDRPDELDRIQNAGGRVIYWDGPRVLGVLAMSRAIGDNYLKPFVIPEPEVTVMDRTAEDECLILASDGLWDVVSNETACSVARMCLQSRKPSSPPQSPGSEVNVAATCDFSDHACSGASILLTKLALARHSTDNISVVVVDLRRCL
ncbi:Protein phosphatase [Actinidia chinensis var. chinensis]|uniref:protein-serine/threonine phosphatase n=1 Tax=Actinidia chinensis var. chinensis TaxID=1590841 RepID=A0A2R6RTK8_ACTCC|nr:Protein phosphatase [Actinidia chinensis var. chinensis]